MSDMFSSGSLTTPKPVASPYSVEGRISELNNVREKLDTALSELIVALFPVTIDSIEPNKKSLDNDTVPNMSPVASKVDDAVSHLYSMLFRVEETQRSLNL